MQFNAYLIGQLIVIILALGLLSMIAYGLRSVLERLRLAERRQRLIRRFTLAALVLWMAVLAVLAGTGFFQHFEWTPPSVVLAAVPPFLIILALLASRAFRIMLSLTPMSWLIYAQTFRLILDLFLWLGYKGGYVPPQMTFAWLNYDIIVGLTAPMAGYVFFGKGRYQRLEAIWWNVFGVLILLNTMLTGLLSLPTAYQVFRTQPDMTFVADFPFVWIPGFFLPLALALHIFSLMQLFWRKGQPRRQFSLRRGDL